MTNLRGALGLVVAASALVASVACSSGVTVEELAAKEAPVLCQVEQRCGGLLFTVLAGDITCASAAEHALDNSSIASLRTAIAAGTVVYHGDQAQACLDAIATADCSVLSQLDGLPACEAAVEGTIAPGARCSISPECTGDAYCKRPAATMAGGTTCPGSCTARVGVGQHCTQNDDCTAGLYCDRTSTCSPPAGVGQACRGAASPECGAGLDCIGDTMTVSGTCHTFASEQSAAAGATCDLQGSVFCMAGLSCAIDSIVGTTPMEICEMPVAAGAACKVAVPEMCPAGQYCKQTVAISPDGTCTALPGVGEACRTAPFPGVPVDPCLGDATCITDGSGNSTCRAKAVNGGACTVDGECWSGHCVASACAEPEVCS